MRNGHFRAKEAAICPRGGRASGAEGFVPAGQSILETPDFPDAPLCVAPTAEAHLEVDFERGVFEKHQRFCRDESRMHPRFPEHVTRTEEMVVVRHHPHIVRVDTFLAAFLRDDFDVAEGMRSTLRPADQLGVDTPILDEHVTDGLASAHAKALLIPTYDGEVADDTELEPCHKAANPQIGVQACLRLVL